MQRPQTYPSMHFSRIIILTSFNAPYSLIAACAAASLAIGTRNGLQDT